MSQPTTDNPANLATIGDRYAAASESLMTTDVPAEVADALVSSLDAAVENLDSSIAAVEAVTGQASNDTANNANNATSAPDSGTSARSVGAAHGMAWNASAWNVA